MRRRASFEALSATGRRRTGRHCWIRYAPLPHDHPDEPHIGYAVGRAVGPAVVRNRIRRRLRAIVAAPDVVLAPGLYLIGVKSDRAATVDHAELREDVRAVLAAATN